jgi:thioredoxin 1
MSRIKGFARFLATIMMVAGLSIAVSQVAPAATEAPYTQQAFVAAQRDGKPILVDITASWCPTCARQRPIIEKLKSQPAFRNLIIYRVDFDKQKTVVRAMHAQMQSTLIVFHGTIEKGRSTGDTKSASIEALLRKAL